MAVQLRAWAALSQTGAVPILPLMTAQFSLMVNGEPRSLEGPLSVAELLATLGLDRRKVAVERNEAIVPRSLYEQTALTQGDWLEIVHFIGGG